MICPECKAAISQENLFKCLSCSSISHKKCNLYTDSDMKQFNIENCDVCRKGQSRQKTKCELCRKGNGMLKVFNYKAKDCWAHANCIKWFPKIIPTLIMGFHTYRYDEKLPALTWTADCFLCKKTSLDFFVKCNKKECNLYAHSKCIISKKLEEVYKEKYEFYTFHCNEHRKTNKENSIGNRLIDLKTYGTGLNKDSDGNDNVMIKIDKENIGIRNNKEDIILNTSTVFLEVIVKEDHDMKRSSIGLNNNNNILEKIVIHDDKDRMRLKQKKNILTNSSTKGNNDNKSYDIITTILRCDFCTRKFDNDSTSSSNSLDTINRCRKCLCVYHLKCESDFYGKSLPHSNKYYRSNLCYKCFISDHDTSSQSYHCIACQKSNGIMLPCNKTWVHYICLKSLNLFFYTKNESKKEYGIDPYKKSKSRDICCICDSYSQYITQCNKCHITFHPYCAFKANFDMNSQPNNLINFPCCSLHHLYDNPTQRNNYSCSIKEAQKLKDLPDSTFSQNTSATSQKDKVVKVTLKKKRLKKITIDKAITSIDYYYLNKKLIQTGLINPFEIAKTEMFHWDLIDPYYISFDKDEMKMILKNGIDKGNEHEKDIIILEQDPVLNENENINLITSSQSDNNDVIIIDEESSAKESNYAICQIKQNENDLYVLYNNKQLKDISIEDFTQNCLQNRLLNNKENDKPNEIIDLTKPTKQFLSKKRHMPSSNNSSVIPVKYIKNFKLNSLSRKILSLESLNITQPTNKHNKTKTFLETELDIKHKMLSSITKETNHLTSILLSNYISGINHMNDNKEVSQLKKQYKSLFNYQKIFKWMMKGFGNKTYEDILLLKSTHNNMANKSLLNKKSIVQKQFLDDSECCVCLTLEPEEATDLVFCDKCNVSFHQNCYGIQKIPEGEYLCDLCLNNKTSDSFIKCILCNNSQGAMKELNDNQWVHVTCIFLSSQMTFKDYILLKEIEVFHNKGLVSNKEMCQICKCSNGEMKQCNCCKKSYHFFCAYFEGYNMVIEDNQMTVTNRRQMTYKINKCVNDSDWNLNYRNEQCEIRKLIYQKKMKNKV